MVGENIIKRELETEKIQEKIEAVHRQGGGEVCISAGIHYIGSLRLYSNITLHLLEGAKLYGSKDYTDYTDFHIPTTMKYTKDPEYKEKWNLPDYYIYGMICAYGEENITIVGEKDSCINGRDCFDANGEEKFRGPMGIIFSSCKNIYLKGYTFENSANWSHQLDSCENVKIEDIKIRGGHDGFNLHHCIDVKIRDCNLQTGDDCLAGYDIQQLEVSDCYFNTACNAMRIGGNDLYLERCIFEGPGKYPHLSEKTYETHALFKYYAIGPDDIRQDAKKIILQDCVIKNMTKLFVYEYGKKEWMQENRPLRELILKNIKINGLTKTSCVKGKGQECSLTLENIVFEDDILCPSGQVLEIDDFVQLNLNHVISKTPLKIKGGKGSKIKRTECENI